jgi:hypothetical protein
MRPLVCAIYDAAPGRIGRSALTSNTWSPARMTINRDEHGARKRCVEICDGVRSRAHPPRHFLSCDVSGAYGLLNAPDVVPARRVVALWRRFMVPLPGLGAWRMAAFQLQSPSLPSSVEDVGVRLLRWHRQPQPNAHSRDTAQDEPLDQLHGNQ